MRVTSFWSTLMWFLQAVAGGGRQHITACQPEVRHVRSEQRLDCQNSRHDQQCGGQGALMCNKTMLQLCAPLIACIIQTGRHVTSMECLTCPQLTGSGGSPSKGLARAESRLHNAQTSQGLLARILSRRLPEMEDKHLEEESSKSPGPARADATSRGHTSRSEPIWPVYQDGDVSDGTSYIVPDPRTPAPAPPISPPSPAGSPTAPSWRMALNNRRLASRTQASASVPPPNNSSSLRPRAMSTMPGSVPEACEGDVSLQGEVDAGAAGRPMVARAATALGLTREDSTDGDEGREDAASSLQERLAFRALQSKSGPLQPTSRLQSRAGA
jgi:hypothetical protein